MKIRNGFVSNSSSSSFIIIDTIGDLIIPDFDKSILNIPGDFGGTCEFGWEIDDHQDFGSRLNFTYLQAMYLGEQATCSEDCIAMNMLKVVLQDKMGVEEIQCNFGWESGNFSGYIDHQSAAYEGENIEMFEDINTLERFLFGKESYVHTDNDNY